MSRNVWRLKAEKWAIWAVLIAVIVFLRHLLPVIFLTFVLTYIGHSLVNRISHGNPRRRRFALILVYIVFLLGATGAALLVVPRMFAEARQLAMLYISRGDAPSTPASTPVSTPASTPVSTSEEETMLDREARRYVDQILIRVFGRDTFLRFARSPAYEDLLERVESSLRSFVPEVVAGVREFVNSSIAVLFQFILAIILSFLILWDFPSLRDGVRSLATGPSADIYSEIAPGMKAFGVMLGRAFEAQTGIAVINALLTSIGLWILGIPSIALLATIVFFCSYIPVAGMFISTIPAALFALQTGGVQLVGWLVVMVLIVHAIEAYALNPIIYGHHMKLHPVAILGILVVGEHLFGIWGLLLGVPISAFLWSYVIRGKGREVEEADAPAGF